MILQTLQSDIISLEGYLESLVNEDPEIKTLVLETSNSPYEMERFDELAKQRGFQYPAMAMLMPIITGDDNSMHNFEARQEVAFVVLYPTKAVHSDRLEKYKLAQLAAWRFIKMLRRDTKKNLFRMDKLAYKMAPFEYGTDNCVGYYVVITIITNTNAQIGS